MSTATQRITALREARAETLARLSDLPEEDLERPVPWRGATNTARFRLSWLAEADDALCVRLLEQRLLLGERPSTAQLVLPGLGAARGALLGTLVGVPETAFEQPPAEGEWSLRFVLAHVLNTDLRYLAAVRYACERQASGRGGPLRPPDESLPSRTGEEQRHGTIAELLGRLQATRDEVLGAVASIPDELLDAPTNWTSWDLDVRFRIHRFAAHDREHTIQVRKTTRALGLQQSEPQLLLADAAVARGALEAAIRATPEALLARPSPLDGRTPITLIEQAVADERETQRLLG